MCYSGAEAVSGGVIRALASAVVVQGTWAGLVNGELREAQPIGRELFA